MVKRIVVGVTARGYVDGRYIGEEKDPRGDDRGRGRTGRGKGAAGIIPTGGRRRGGAAVDADNLGNTIGGKRRRSGQGKPVPSGQPRAATDSRGKGQGTGQGKERGQGRTRQTKARGADAAFAPVLAGDAQPPRSRGRQRGPGVRVAGANALAGATGYARNAPRAPRNARNAPNVSSVQTGQFASGLPRDPARTPVRNSRGTRKTPFRAPQMSASPSEVTDFRRVGDEAKSGQFAEALATQANVKRERLHKVLAQSGHGSRRDMEIMISSGRVMVNGIVATTGIQVSPGDNVQVDQRPVKLKFDEELPRILLYHKPEGEIVTTSDPGNRITVFDNLPKVENGKWVAIGRLDINTSGLLIFTTNGELANRLMHPRYEVEREYAVRILGELTEEQTERLLTGVNIGPDEESDEPSVPARFDTIDKRGGEGVNQWYHVTIKEGRNREVRKMFETQGLTVSRLIRTRFGKIELPPRLARGKLMELDVGQVNGVLGWVGMSGPGATPARPPRAKKPPRPARGEADAQPFTQPERGNELGPVVDYDALDAADDIGNVVSDIDLPPISHDDGDAPHARPRSGRVGLRGRGGRGRGPKRDANPALGAGNTSAASGGNRAEVAPTPAFIPHEAPAPERGAERQRNPKTRRRARRAPRSAGAQAAFVPNDVADEKSGNES